jgi:predicted ester cyclase
MTPEELKAFVHRYVEEWSSEGDSAILAEYYAPDFVCHRPPYPDTEGVAGYAEWIEGFRRAFPDVKYRLAETIVEGQTVAARLVYSGTHTGSLGPDLAPTGREVSGSGCIVWHWVNGKVAEEWHYWDELGFWTQLGFQLIPQQTQ